MTTKKTTKPATGPALSGPDRLVAVGNAGAAFCITLPPDGFPVDGTPTVAQFRSFKSAGIEAREVGEQHAAGEGCGLPEWDAALFVSHRGTPVRVLPLSMALAKGIVTRHAVCLRRDGMSEAATVFSRAGWTPAMRQDQFLATADMPAGRVEARLVNEPDGGPARNRGYCGKVLPLAFLKTSGATKPAPVASAKPAKPAKPAAKAKPAK